MFLLMAVLMSISTSTFAGTTTAKSESPSHAEFVIPTNLIVKQTITFTDGKSIQVFYQKEGDTCRIYSKEDVTRYSESDLNRIKSTHFEIADHCEGKCLLTRKATDILSLAKTIFTTLR